MAVVIDFLSDFEDSFWIEPYGEESVAHPTGCRGDMMNAANRGDDLPNRV